MACQNCRLDERKRDENVLSPQRITVTAFWIACLTTCLANLGCNSSRPIDEKTAESAQAAFDEGLAQVEAGNHKEAVASFDQALTPGGGLSADLYSTARIERAKCLARVGRYEDAHADLEVASQGSVNLAIVHACRSFVFKCEGKDAEASKEMAAAKKIDRRVKAIR